MLPSSVDTDRVHERSSDLTRVVAPAAAFLLAFTMAIGCDSRDEGAESQPIQDSLQLAAVRQVIGNHPVRWISDVELCLVSFDAETIPGCEARPKRRVAEAQVRALRGALREPGDSNAMFACVRVSRAITRDDSILVAIATVGDLEVDGVVESAMQWVWFPRQGGEGRGRVVVNPYGGGSDTDPIKDPSEC